MKKIIFLSIISLFCITGLFAQSSWEVKFDWTEDEEQCACQNYATASYKVEITVYDDANSTAVGTPYTGYVSYPALSYTHPFDSSPINVKYYCNELNHENTPSFTIRCSISFGHWGSTPPIEHCSDSEADSGVSCLNFSSGYTFNTPILLE